MGQKNKYIFSIILIFLFLGCTTTRVTGVNKELPTKSYVKVFHTTIIHSCTDPKDKKCPIGEFMQLGSGMAIELINNEPTVISAGHVCDSQPSNAIKESNQIIHVLDHKRNMHQAWPILINHNNQKGSADLCLLWVPTLKVKGVKFSKVAPKIGDELHYIGSPKGIYHPPAVPIFKGIFSGEINTSSSILTAPATQGASGSAVLNERREIVGILWGVNSHFNNVATITSYRSFIIFLKNAKKEFKKKYQ